MKKMVIITAMVISVLSLGCNHSMSSMKETDGNSVTKRDRSRRTVIDNAEYIDFTIKKYNAKIVKREDMLYALNGVQYKNGNSSITIKMKEGVIELNSDNGYFNNKKNCQIYGVFAFDIQAASEDCLYIRKDQKKPGFLMIDNFMYRDDAVPDLAVCLPLYGYSRNRIEVSSVMDGYIVMPSGTYWRK